MKKYHGKLNIGSWASQFDDEGYLWLSDFNFGGLYKCDTKRKVMTLEHIFDGQNERCVELHREMLICKKNIILTPLCDKYLRIYNTDSKIEYKVMLPDEQNEYKTVIYRGKVLFWAKDCSVFRYDHKTKEFVKDDFLTHVMKEIECVDTALIRVGVGDSLTFWNESKKMFADIDVDKNSYNVIEVRQCPDVVWNVFHIKDKYWFIFQNSSDVMARDEAIDSYTYYKAISFEFLEGRSSIPYSKVIEFKENILLPNYYGTKYMRINESEHIIEQLCNEEVSGDIGGLRYGACYLTCLEHDEYLYCIPQRCKNILVIDKDCNAVDTIPMEVEVNDDYLEQIIFGLNNHVIDEEKGIISLNNFVKYVCTYGM